MNCASNENIPTSKIPETKAQIPDYKTDEDLRQEAMTLEEDLVNDPQNTAIIIQLAGIYQEIGQLKDALRHLENLKSMNYSEDPRVYGSLANIYKSQEDFEEALINYELFLSMVAKESPTYPKIEDEIRQLQFIIKTQSNPYDLVLRPLNEEVNTISHEYLPQFSMDGSSFIFTRRFFEQEDLFIAEKKDGRFEVRPIEEINTLYNEGAHTLSADGKTLILTQCNEKRGYGNCDLYSTNKLPTGKWAVPSNMGMRINSRFWDAQPSLSSDGRTLYFASRREGGKGGSDIWYAQKRSDGKWTVPKNIGAPVNGKRDDESPFIHPDGKTLFFRSKSHDGLGGFDLFRSIKNEGTWTTPQHLGSPLNSTGNDGALVVDLSGTKGYYATDTYNNIKKNNLDIVEFVLPEPFRPHPMTYIKGQVKESGSGHPVSAEIRIASLDHSHYRSLYYTDTNGEFLAAVPVGEPILVNVTGDGYVFYSENLNFENINYSAAAETFDIELQPLALLQNQASPESKPVILKNIFFASGSSDLLSSSESEILILYGLLRENSEINIRIIGHTDDIGEEEDNIILSESRAESVREALIDKGIIPSRITAEGRGENEPIASNETEEGRAINRRTEFVIINK